MSLALTYIGYICILKQLNLYTTFGVRLREVLHFKEKLSPTLLAVKTGKTSILYLDLMRPIICLLNLYDDSPINGTEKVTPE